MKNIDVLKKKLTEKINNLNADNFCSNMFCCDCPFGKFNCDDDSDCEEDLIEWLNEDAE